MPDANGNTWKAGDVVQIDPAHDPRFGGCFMVVSEPKTWGAQGYCDGPGAEGERGLAYYRLPYRAGLLVGRAVWLEGDLAKELDEGGKEATNG